MPQVYRNFAKKAIAVALFLLTPTAVGARIPNDPGYVYQKRVWQQINAPAAWDIAIGSPQVVVAAIDTGADIWHPDLSANIWINPYEIPDNGIDDDHNGYVDDIHGWNFVENNSNLHASASAADAADDEQSMVHGTVVAGLIGAVGNNSTDVTGMNWNVKIMPLRAIQSNGTGKYENVIQAIQYAVRNGASVISMSFEGDEPSPKLEEALYRAYEKGVVIVAAAGNHEPEVSGNFDDAPKYPACFNQNRSSDWLLTVGSVDTHDVLSTFSNYGRCLNIVAPGENIVSTDWYAPTEGYTNQYSGPWAGTSFAAPLVAGTAALIKSIHPEWSPTQVIQTIQNTADSIASQNTTSLTVGRLNAGAALAEAFASTPVPPLWHGSVFTMQKNSVGRATPTYTNTTPFTKIDGATVLAVTAAAHDPGEYVFVLYRRGSKIMLRTLTATGVILQEKSIAPPKNIGLAYTSVSLGAGIDTSDSPVVVINWRDKKNLSSLQVVSPSGQIRATHRTPNQVAAWAYDANTQEFFTARSTANGVVIDSVNWNSGDSHSWTLGVTGTADMMRLVGDSVALTTHTATEAYLTIMNRATTALTSVPLATGVKIPAWYLWPVQNTQTLVNGVVAFPLGQAGERTVYDLSGSVAGSFAVPALTGLVR